MARCRGRFSSRTHGGISKLLKFSWQGRPLDIICGSSKVKHEQNNDERELRVSIMHMKRDSGNHERWIARSFGVNEQQTTVVAKARSRRLGCWKCGCREDLAEGVPHGHPITAIVSGLLPCTLAPYALRRLYFLDR